jgi:hypothetical protein
MIIDRRVAPRTHRVLRPANVRAAAVMISMAGSATRGLVLFGTGVMRRAGVALATRLVNGLARGGPTHNKSCQISRIRPKWARIAMASAALNLKAGVSSRERARRSVPPPGASIDQEPGHVAGSEDHRPRRQQELETDNRIALEVIVERNPQRPLLGRFIHRGFGGHCLLKGRLSVPQGEDDMAREQRD